MTVSTLLKWNIVTDSACDLLHKDIACEEVGFSCVPFSIRIADKEYKDDENLNVLEMLTHMENCPTASGSSCPSPYDWEQEFLKSEQTVVITISGNLSGSLNSALVAKDTVLAKHPERKIMVLDSRSTGPEIALCVYKIVGWIKDGLDFETINEKAQEFLDKTKTSFALSSFDNLVKNGRMSKLTGFVARKLGMWGIGIASDIGTIAMKGKSRGPKKAVALLLEDMEERGFSGKEVAISHCENEDMVQKLKESILVRWPTAEIKVLKTRGLDSYYAERGGLIISFC